ncbi:MAG: hypothetical protein N3A64_04340, partial [Desulfobacterota bacterium]|nr:hypothetical protein [Thermodesulfobacteriota bacterium]
MQPEPDKNRSGKTEGLIEAEQSKKNRFKDEKESLTIPEEESIPRLDTEKEKTIPEETEEKLSPEENIDSEVQLYRGKISPLGKKRKFSFFTLFGVLILIVLIIGGAYY